MNREIHVRICESLRGQFPRATRPAQRASCHTSHHGTEVAVCSGNEMMSGRVNMVYDRGDPMHLATVNL
jgi:hypothetical protein